MSKPKPEPKQGLAALFALELRTKIIAGVVGVIVAGVLAGLSGFLPDYGHLDDVQQKRVLLDSTVEINPIIEPKWWPLRRTHFVADGFGDGLQPAPGAEMEFPLPAVKERKYLSQLLDRRSPPVLQASAAGRTTLKLRLKSGDRVLHEVPMTIEVVKHVEYNGAWTLEMGERRGKVHLHTSPGNDEAVYGLILLNDYSQGLISGQFKGTAFEGVATLGESATRIKIEAPTKMENNTRIIASGTSRWYEVRDQEWKPVEGSEETFKMWRELR